ncbi:MAG: M48 family metalloprotease [Ignavibacteriales bacterium]|nr:M48 family metalloprotease [Ignavibacteriales bacterium]
MRTLLLSFIIFFHWCSAQETQFTKRPRNDVRNGPGAYYELIRTLPEGVPLTIEKTEKNWVKIKSLDNSEAWISKNCLVDKKPAGNPVKELTKEWLSPATSKTAIAAAIRGFAQRFGKADEGDPSFLEYAGEMQFDTGEYQSFLKETMQEISPKQMEELGNVQSMFSEYENTLTAEGIGAGIASRVAAKGFVKDAALLKYINLLGMYLVESSPSYDEQFHFFILPDARTNAFSVPGGYIFITKGMLDECENEAELAGAISHEVAHLLLNHGVKEIKARTALFKMEKYMQNVQKLVNDELRETEKSIELYSTVLYDLVHRPKTVAIEEEADKLAAVLLALSGYDPRALTQLLKKTETASKQSLSKNYDQEQTYSFFDLKQRRDHLQKFIDGTLSHIKGKMNLERFKANMK